MPMGTAEFRIRVWIAKLLLAAAEKLAYLCEWVHVVRLVVLAERSNSLKRDRFEWPLRRISFTVALDRPKGQLLLFASRNAKKGTDGQAPTERVGDSGSLLMHLPCTDWRVAPG